MVEKYRVGVPVFVSLWGPVTMVVGIFMYQGYCPWRGHWGLVEINFAI